MRRPTTFMIAVLALSACFLRADDKSFPDLPGEWKYAPNRDYASLFGLTLGQNRTFMGKLDSLAAVLRATNVFNPPRGFQARARGGYFTIHCEGSSCIGKPVQARLEVIFYYFVEGAKGQPTWGGEVNTSAELRINDPLHVLSSKYSLWSGGLWLPDGREISLEPQETGQVAGFPLYDSDLVVFTRKGIPCWTPVTRSQFLGALLADREATTNKQSAELKGAKDPYQAWLSERPARLKNYEDAYQQSKKIDPVKAEDLRAQFKKMEAEMEAGLKAKSAVVKPEANDPYRAVGEGLRAELAGMTPKESASPAWYINPDDSGSGLVPPNTPHAQRLVTLNPGYFLRSRPSTDIQLISIRLYFEGLSQQNIGNQKLQEFLTTADWKRVAAFLDEQPP
jgi:hypothetical protein